MKIKIGLPQIFLIVIQLLAVMLIMGTYGRVNNPDVIGANKFPVAVVAFLGTFFGVVFFNLLLLMGEWYGDYDSLGKK